MQTTGSLRIILLEIPFHRLIHTVPAQYTLICQLVVGFYVDPIRLGQPDPFAFDQADLFQFLQELHCFLLAAALMVLAQPFGMGSAISLWHESPFLSQ